MKTWYGVMVGLALMLLSERALAVGIRGATSCGQWVAGREKAAKSDGAWGKIESVRDEAWLAGYLSGLASGTGKDFWGRAGVDELRNESVFLWVDNYCRAKPLMELDDAAKVVFIERTQGK